MDSPRNKKDFYQRYLNGEFGNKPRTWANWLDLFYSDYNGKVTIRDVNPGGPCVYNFPVSDLRDGFLPKGIPNLVEKTFNESMPDDKLLIQGNVWLSDTGLCLDYSCEKNISHRESQKPPNIKHAKLLMATSLLKINLDSPSYDNLLRLLSSYDDAIIEFSTYEFKVGELKQNTVFWEVRNY